MTVEEAKARAVECGSVKINRGVYLMTGEQVLEDTQDYRDTMCTDRVADDCDAQDIIPDQLYIQAGEYFVAAGDEDIEKCLSRN